MERIIKPISRLALLVFMMLAVNRSGLAQTETTPVPNMRTMLLRDERAVAQLDLSARQQQFLRQALDKVDTPLWRLRDQDAAQRQAQVSALLQQFDDALTQLFAMRRGYGRQGPFLQRRAYEVLLIQNLAQEAAANSLLPKIRKRACPAPELTDVATWINSPGLTLASQRGKVVLLHFFTSDCGNCINNFAAYNRWFQAYNPNEVAMVGIHRPESDHERPVDRVREKITKHSIAYPVAVDNDSKNWNLWANHVWPSIYLIDRAGFVRYWWYGELNFGDRQGEAWVQTRVHELLQEPR
jgi:peroxiredoxin